MNKKSPRLLGALAAAALLSGCGMDIDNLRPASDGAYVTVASEYVRLADISAPACKWLVTYRVAPGKYPAEFYGNGGAYYRAPPKFLRFERRKMTCPGLESKALPPVEFKGGIFIPDNPEKPALLYRYLGEQSVDYGAVSDLAQTQEAAKPVGTQDPVAAGVGGAAASGIIAAIGVAESDNLMFLGDQAKDQSFRAVLVKSEPSVP